MIIELSLETLTKPLVVASSMMSYLSLCDEKVFGEDYGVKSNNIADWLYKNGVTDGHLADYLKKECTLMYKIIFGEYSFGGRLDYYYLCKSVQILSDYIAQASDEVRWNYMTMLQKDCGITSVSNSDLECYKEIRSDETISDSIEFITSHTTRDIYDHFKNKPLTEVR